MSAAPAERTNRGAHLKRNCPIKAGQLVFMLARRGLTSIGSPSAVPVPCASRALKLPPPPSMLETTASNRRCDDPFGAVRLALGPSYYTPDASTEIEVPAISSYKQDTYSRGSLSTNVQQPSPRQYPSARRSNVWHRPNEDSIPAAENAYVTPAASIPMPVAAARGHWARFKLDAARWRATSDDEQAVSRDRQGPVSPST